MLTTPSTADPKPSKNEIYVRYLSEPLAELYEAHQCVRNRFVLLEQLGAILSSSKNRGHVQDTLESYTGTVCFYSPSLWYTHRSVQPLIIGLPENIFEGLVRLRTTTVLLSLDQCMGAISY